jgi:hypothetical protein
VRPWCRNHQENGTVLSAGTQTLSVTLTPTDTTDYNTATATVQLTVNQTTPTISISDIPTSPFNGGSFTITYSYSGDGSPSVSSSTAPVCTTSGNTVNFVGVGMCTLTASATATADYMAVTGYAQTFNVSARSPIVIPAPGIINTIAGNGPGSYSGDGEAATSAELYYPNGVTVDSAGNIYFADQASCVIRKVTVSTGVISTVAGNGTPGYSGDGGAATSAELNSPGGVAVDSIGNIYIADSSNFRIRKVTVSTGIISTVAGDGGRGYSGDGGLATSADLLVGEQIEVNVAGDCGWQPAIFSLLRVRLNLTKLQSAIQPAWNRSQSFSHRSGLFPSCSFQLARQKRA